MKSGALRTFPSRHMPALSRTHSQTNVSIRSELVHHHHRTAAFSTPPGPTGLLLLLISERLRQPVLHLWETRVSCLCSVCLVSGRHISLGPCVSTSPCLSAAGVSCAAAAAAAAAAAGALAGTPLPTVAAAGEQRSPPARQFNPFPTQGTVSGEREGPATSW